jgi:hypothetical protein
VTTNDFIDRLEDELRAAGRRRVRLELARVPRVPLGATVLALTVAVIAAVAVPLLATHARSPATSPTHPRSGSPVTVTCGDTVSGVLPAGWATSQMGSEVTGPVAWAYLSRDANHRAIYRSHFVQALAVVRPGRPVTVTIPPAERGQLALDYTDVSPRPRFYLGQGVSAVTFKPCPGSPGQTQFNGGFIVSRAQCAVFAVHVAGSSTGARYFVSLGKSCQARVRSLNVLKGHGIGRAVFGERLAAVTRKLDALLGRGPTKTVHGRECGIESSVDWPGLETYFHRHRFAGYSYGGLRHTGIEPILATGRGLRVGSTVAQGKRLYGRAFGASVYNGGSWVARTHLGRLEGFTSRGADPKGRILTIEAGVVGCPALTP